MIKLYGEEDDNEQRRHELFEEATKVAKETLDYNSPTTVDDLSNILNSEEFEDSSDPKYLKRELISYIGNQYRMNKPVSFNKLMEILHDNIAVIQNVNLNGTFMDLKIILTDVFKDVFEDISVTPIPKLDMIDDDMGRKQLTISDILIYNKCDL